MHMNIEAPDPTCRYLACLRDLEPLVKEHRASFDRDRQLPDPVFEALADAGLFRLWLPRSLGGPELSPLQFMSVVEAASAMDGTIGWLVGNGGGMSRTGGYLDSTIAREIFSHQRTFMVSATGAVCSATEVDGGYRVTGRWPFGSGAPHGSHFMGLVAVENADSPGQIVCCYLDRVQVTVHDTWHVSGLRGTGSSDFEVFNAFVPTRRTHPFIGHEPVENGLLYRMPPISVFSWTVSVVPLGIARGAIYSFVSLALSKAKQGANLLRDREVVQTMVGRVEALHAAARSFLVEAMTELVAATNIGGHRLVEARAQLRIATAHAAETAVRIVEMLAAEAGATVIFESSPLERAIRDVQAATKHIAMTPSSYGVYGRVTLGLDPGTTRF